MTSLTENFAQFAAQTLPPGISKATYLRFQSLSRYVTMARDQSVDFVEPGEQFVFLGKGATKLVAHASKSRDQIVAFHFAGDVFSVPECDNYSYSVSALRDCELLTFAADEFLELAASEPFVLRHLLDRTTDSLRRCQQKAIALGRKTASERIAVFLLSMAKRIGDRCDNAVLLDLPMSRRDIAESLGLTIETVSRHLTLLRTSHTISTEGRSGILLQDLSGLEARAGYLREAA